MNRLVAWNELEWTSFQLNANFKSTQSTADNAKCNSKRKRINRGDNIGNEKRNEDERAEWQQFQRFFTVNDTLETWTRQINQKHAMQSHACGRLIEYFFTTYMHEHECVYYIAGTGLDRSTWLYCEQPSQCSAKHTWHRINVKERHGYMIDVYHKRGFDYCRRGKKCSFSYRNGELKIETTIAQLRFFWWARSLLFDEFWRRNHMRVEEEMKAGSKSKNGNDAVRGEVLNELASAMESTHSIQVAPIHCDAGYATECELHRQRRDPHLFIKPNFTSFNPLLTQGSLL